jgi:hypothetical protein
MRWVYLAIALILGIARTGQAAPSTTLYSTGFEAAEGFDPQFTLAGQPQAPGQAWASEGTGGNGLLLEAFEGMGQQAYIGFHPPTDTNDFTSVWKPLDVSLPAGQKIVRFSVTMQIVQSTAGGDDAFRWSVYSSGGARLFSLEFDTRTGNIDYILSDGQYRSAGFTFDFEGLYDLVIWMNFQNNHWTALLNDTVIVNSETIAASTADLSFGDVDAVWLISNMQGVGNNYMLFDNYRITAEALSSIPAVLEPVGVDAQKNFEFFIHGEKDFRYSVEVTSDFVEWFSLGIFDNPNGSFRFQDTFAKDFPTGFYRVRQAP